MILEGVSSDYETVLSDFEMVKIKIKKETQNQTYQRWSFKDFKWLEKKTS